MSPPFTNTPASRPATPIVLIAAVGANGAIGRDNRLIWRLKADMAQFRVATAGRPLVMGRKTFDSLGRPLPRRLNIVVSRRAGLSLAGAVTAGSLAQALTTAHGEALRSGVGEIVVLGGGDIYGQAMALADRLLITHVEDAPAADTFFPPIDPALWTGRELMRQAADADNDRPFRLVDYRRTSG